jgi:hypothetical protein
MPEGVEPAGVRRVKAEEQQLGCGLRIDRVPHPFDVHTRI